MKSSGAVRGITQRRRDPALGDRRARGRGPRIARSELWHVDTCWTYPGEGRYDGLLVREDLGAASDALLAQVPERVRAAQRTLAGAEPGIAMGAQCTSPFDCPFQRWCAAQAGPQPEYPVTLLPNNKGKKLAAELIAEGYADLREVPPNGSRTPSWR